MKPLSLVKNTHIFNCRRTFCLRRELGRWSCRLPLGAWADLGNASGETQEEVHGEVPQEGAGKGIEAFQGEACRRGVRSTDRLRHLRVLGRTGAGRAERPRPWRRRGLRRGCESASWMRKAGERVDLRAVPQGLKYAGAWASPTSVRSLILGTRRLCGHRYLAHDELLFRVSLSSTLDVSASTKM